MKLGIKVSTLENEPGYMAQVDWSKGDAGKVGTPGAIRYGETEQEAHEALERLLETKGHEIVE